MAALTRTSANKNTNHSQKYKETNKIKKLTINRKQNKNAVLNNTANVKANRNLQTNNQRKTNRNTNTMQSSSFMICILSSSLTDCICVLIQSITQVVGAVHGEHRRDGDSSTILWGCSRLPLLGQGALLLWQPGESKSSKTWHCMHAWESPTD